MTSPGASAAAAADYDVLILGGGLAGLVAARRLLADLPQLRLLVLEAKDRVGGRTLSADLPCGRGAGATDRWDLGGQWVGDSQSRVCRLTEELGLRRHLQHCLGRKILEAEDGRVSEYSGELPSIGLLGNLDLVRTILSFESQVAAAFEASGDGSATKAAEAAAEVVVPPELSPAHAQLDSITMATVSARLSWTGSVRSLFASAARVLFGQEPAAVSALYAVKTCHSAGDFQRLISSEPSGAQGYRIVGGAQGLSLRLADLLGPDRVRLRSPVVAVESPSPSTSTLTVRLADGSRLSARQVVSAMPPNQLARLDFSAGEGLPAWLRDAFAAAAPAHYAKFIVTYETAWWREMGFSGELVSCDPRAPIVAGFDGTSDAGSAALVLLSAGRPSQDLECLPADRRRAAVLAHLGRFFAGAGGPRADPSRASNCVHFAEKFWRAEPYNGGCPSDTVPCGYGRYQLGGGGGGGAPSAFGGRLLFAGTEFAAEWVGYMEGAVQSGERAAAAAALRLTGVVDGCCASD